MKLLLGILRFLMVSFFVKICFQYLKTELLELAKYSGPEKVKRMLVAFQGNKRMEFKPDPSVRHQKHISYDTDSDTTAMA